MNETVLEAPAPEDQTIEAAPEKTDTLVVSDRCDLCGSQAYVGVVLESGDLMFCSHHFNSFEDKLRETATLVIDERWKLSTNRLDVSA